MAWDPGFLVAFGLLVLWTFWSGFTDAANAISTVVGSRVLRPIQAVGVASLGNFLGVFFGEAVARTFAQGIVPESEVVPGFVFAVIVGGFAFDVVTYIKGLPISETQVLVGGLMGAGLAAVGLGGVKIVSTLQKVLIPMAMAPIVAFFVAVGIMAVIVRIFRPGPAAGAGRPGAAVGLGGRIAEAVRRFRGASPEKVNRWFGKAQIGSSFFFSVSHGANDAMKSAGIMAALLFTSAGATGTVDVPVWLRVLAVSVLALGTLLGGWRIVRTMGFRVTQLRPYQGFVAETGAALVVLGSSQLGFPLSTTQTVSGSIMGVGAAKGFSAVRWRVVRQIVAAWLLTIPAAATFAFIVYTVVRLGA
jgi:inorganic phosphate transporter, PiT family